MPTGKLGPALYVSYKISQQLVKTTDSNGSFLRQKAIVHSIAAEPGQNIDLGDFDLIVGDDIVRLKHIASDPEWLVLSSDTSAIFASRESHPLCFRWTSRFLPLSRDRWATPLVCWLGRFVIGQRGLVG